MRERIGLRRSLLSRWWLGSRREPPNGFGGFAGEMRRPSLALRSAHCGTHSQDFEDLE
jgi:hypothetical protein